MKINLSHAHLQIQPATLDPDDLAKRLKQTNSTLYTVTITIAGGLDQAQLVNRSNLTKSDAALLRHHRVWTYPETLTRQLPDTKTIKQQIFTTLSRKPQGSVFATYKQIIDQLNLRFNEHHQTLPSAFREDWKDFKTLYAQVVPAASA